MKSGPADKRARRAREERDRTFAPIRQLVTEALQVAARAHGVAVPALRFQYGLRNATGGPDGVTVDPEWLVRRLADVCVDASCEREVALGLLAHELGHVLDPRLNAEPDKRLRELRADHFAGRVLALVGLGPFHFARFLSVISPYGTETHPVAAPWRHQVLYAGWSEVTAARYAA